MKARWSRGKKVNERRHEIFKTLTKENYAIRSVTRVNEPLGTTI